MSQDIYQIINKLNMFYDMIGKQIKVSDIISEEELIALIDYINYQESKEQNKTKLLRK